MNWESLFLKSFLPWFTTERKLQDLVEGRQIYAGLTLRVSCRILQPQLPQVIMWAAGGLGCIGGGQGEFCTLVLSVQPPQCCPTVEEEGRLLPHNKVSIKPTEADWVGLAGKLGERGQISAVYPALLVFFSSPVLERTHPHRWNRSIHTDRVKSNHTVQPLITSCLT